MKAIFAVLLFSRAAAGPAESFSFLCGGLEAAVESVLPGLKKSFEDKRSCVFEGGVGVRIRLPEGQTEQLVADIQLSLDGSYRSALIFLPLFEDRGGRRLQEKVRDREILGRRSSERLGSSRGRMLLTPEEMEDREDTVVGNLEVEEGAQLTTGRPVQAIEGTLGGGQALEGTGAGNLEESDAITPGAFETGQVVSGNKPEKDEVKEGGGPDEGQALEGARAGNIEGSDQITPGALEADEDLKRNQAMVESKSNIVEKIEENKVLSPSELPGGKPDPIEEGTVSAIDKEKLAGVQNAGEVQVDDSDDSPIVEKKAESIMVILVESIRKFATIADETKKLFFQNTPEAAFEDLVSVLGEKEVLISGSHQGASLILGEREGTLFISPSGAGKFLYRLDCAGDSDEFLFPPGKDSAAKAAESIVAALKRTEQVPISKLKEIARSLIEQSVVGLANKARIPGLTFRLLAPDEAARMKIDVQKLSGLEGGALAAFEDENSQNSGQETQDNLSTASLSQQTTSTVVEEDAPGVDQPEEVIKVQSDLQNPPSPILDPSDPTEPIERLLREEKPLAETSSGSSWKETVLAGGDPSQEGGLSPGSFTVHFAFFPLAIFGSKHLLISARSPFISKEIYLPVSAAFEASLKSELDQLGTILGNMVKMIRKMALPASTRLSYPQLIQLAEKILLSIKGEEALSDELQKTPNFGRKIESQAPEDLPFRLAMGPLDVSILGDEKKGKVVVKRKGKVSEFEFELENRFDFRPSLEGFLRENCAGDKAKDPRLREI